MFAGTTKQKGRKPVTFSLPFWGDVQTASKHLSPGILPGQLSLCYAVGME